MSTMSTISRGVNITLTIYPISIIYSKIAPLFKPSLRVCRNQSLTLGSIHKLKRSYLLIKQERSRLERLQGNNLTLGSQERRSQSYSYRG
jgi:hypothetical protein